VQERQRDEARLLAKIEAAIFNAQGGIDGAPVTPAQAMGEPEPEPPADDEPAEDPGEADAARWWATMAPEDP
jgi:hypothetical protein